MLVLALLMTACAVMLWQSGKRKTVEEQVLARLGLVTVGEPALRGTVALTLLERAFLRAGLNVPSERMRLILLSWLGLMMTGGLFGGLFLWLVMMILPPILLRLYLDWRSRRRNKRMIEQLPLMLDQVLRSLQTGRTLGDAMIRAILAAPEPLRGSMHRVSRNVQLGVELDEALQETATIYGLEELQILALGIRVNHRYGGSASELLQNLINLIQERDHIARQFRAMTGETRITAWVLGGLPLLMAVYILSVNPSYLMNMWSQADGRQMLMVSLGLEAFGSFLLWRMTRSV